MRFKNRNETNNIRNVFSAAFKKKNFIEFSCDDFTVAASHTIFMMHPNQTNNRRNGIILTHENRLLFSILGCTRKDDTATDSIWYTHNLFLF